MTCIDIHNFPFRYLLLPPDEELDEEPDDEPDEEDPDE